VVSVIVENGNYNENEYCCFFHARETELELYTFDDFVEANKGEANKN